MSRFEGSILRHGSAFAILLAVSGCVAMGGNQADGRLTMNSKWLENSTWDACVKAGLVAAAGDYGIGILRNENRSEGEQIKRGVAAGAAGCAIGAGVDAWYKSAQNRDLNQQQRLKEALNQIQQENDHLTQLLSATRHVMAEDRAEIEAIARRMQAREITKAQARQQLATVNANQAEMRQTLAALEKRQANWQAISARERAEGSQTAALDQQIAQMDQKIEFLREELAAIEEHERLNGLA